MIIIHPILLLLIIIVLLLFILIMWGLWQARNNSSNGALTGADGGNLQLWFLALGLFAMGVFVTYVMILALPGGV